MKKQIQNIFLNSSKNVRAVFYGNKKTRKKITGERAIVFVVDKKLPIYDVTKKDIIPSIINIDGVDYLTDVIESSKFLANQCYDFTDPEVTSLNKRIRPLSGGIEISSLSFWTQTAPFEFDFSVGTLGFFAIDNEDQKLVAVTAGHIVVLDVFSTTEREPSSNDQTNITDPTVFSMSGGLNATFTSRVLQFGSLENRVNFNDDKIGVVKRYSVLYDTQPNTVDAALISITTGVTNNSILSQAGLPNAFDMDFASTAEIDSLLDEYVPLYSVGRTTGPKGITCPLSCVGFGSAEIGLLRQFQTVNIDMTDLFFYSYLDSSNLPAFSGDSGSAIIGDFNGTCKIVGMNISSDGQTDPVLGPIGTIGVACRIDKIAEKLNISPVRSNSTWSIGSDQYSKIILPLQEGRESAEFDGKKYFQVGSEITRQSPISFPTPTPTPTPTTTPSLTPTRTPTATPTSTPSVTPTNTSTPSETPTNTPTQTRTPSNTPTVTPTNTPTPSNTATPTQTQTPSNTPTQTRTPSNTPTRTQTPTPSNTPTRTPTNTPTQTQTPTRTQTPTPTNTPTQTQTPSQTRTQTPTVTPTNTPTQTRTPSNTPTRTQTPTPSNTPTRTPTNTPSQTRTPTNTQTPSNTPSQTRTPTPTQTETPTRTPTRTPV